MFAAFGPQRWESEPLMRLTGGQMDSGALAVNAFFVISGLLVTQSWERSPRLSDYLAKRARRIYPGFIVASLVSLVLMAPLAGAPVSALFNPGEAARSAARIVLLSAPKSDGAFHGSAVPVLNLPLWTIRYEFLCYLLVPLLISALRMRRGWLLALYLAALAWHGSQGVYLVDRPEARLSLLGNFEIWPRFLAYFLGGMVFSVFADRIPFSFGLFGLCLVALIVTGGWTGGFFVATATVGIYVAFYLAYQRGVSIPLAGRRWDLSYGTYLYGWPIQMLIVRNLGGRLGLWGCFALVLPLTLAVAAMSWTFIELPWLRRAHSRRQRRSMLTDPAEPVGAA